MVVASTVAVAPVAVSVTAQLVPNGTVSGEKSVRPAGVPAATVNDSAVPSSQMTSTTISPWLPAAGPATTLLTCSVADAAV